MFCTVALFLSGYVIQQRTLNDLRTAIRPRQPRRSPPQFYLPEQFKTQNADGLVGNQDILQDIEAAQVVKQSEDGGIMIEVVQSEPTTSSGTSSSAPIPEGNPESPPSRGKSNTEQQSLAIIPVEAKDKKKLAIVEGLKAQVARKTWMVEHPDPLSKNRVPITRVERRRLIKEEISRLAQANEPVYYQRRLW